VNLPDPHARTANGAITRGVSLSEDAFARLVGRHGDALLFEVCEDFMEDEWSEPVQYRFVRTEGGLLSLEMRRV
jgi:hypothetical protein